MSAEESRGTGVFIPEGVRHIYIFNDEKDFREQVDSGQMKPIYGHEDYQRAFIPIYVAYKSESEGKSFG